MGELDYIKKRLIKPVEHTYLIRYTLHNEEGSHVDYKHMIDSILEKYSCAWHCLFSTWVIKTTDSETQILNYLSKHLDSDDAIIITKLITGHIFKGKFDSNIPKCLSSDIIIIP